MTTTEISLTERIVIAEQQCRDARAAFKKSKDKRQIPSERAAENYAAALRRLEKLKALDSSLSNV